MMHETSVIRPMRAEDIERVLIIAASVKNAPHWPRSAYLSALDPRANPLRVALVATDFSGKRPVGFVIASLVPPGAELETISVATECQRQGTGGALLRNLVDALRRYGVQELWLEVRPSNLAAIALYHRAGFVENGVRNRYYVDPVEDATVMKLTMS